MPLKGGRDDSANELGKFRQAYENAKFPGALIHEPWKAETALRYPPPIVDHAQAREKAVAFFKE